MKRVTGSATKRRKAENARATRQKLVNLRSYIKDWRQIGDENNCDNDADIAKLLIEWYVCFQGPSQSQKQIVTYVHVCLNVNKKFTTFNLHF